MGNSPTPQLDMSKFQPLEAGAPTGAYHDAAQSGDTSIQLDMSKFQPSDGVSNEDVQAARPGAYQQSKGAPIHNSQDDAAHPFSDSTTSVLPAKYGGGQGAMAKREGESDTQFMARVKEAGKNVTAEQRDAENEQNKKGIVPTLGVAAAAGPAQILAGESLAIPAEAGIESIATRSLKPLIPLIRTGIGSWAGSKGGRWLGGMLGHPDIGAAVGGVAGGGLASQGVNVPNIRQWGMRTLMNVLDNSGEEAGAAVAPEAAESVVSDKPFNLIPSEAETEPAVQTKMNFPKSAPVEEAPKGNSTPFGAKMNVPKDNSMKGLDDLIEQNKLKPNVPLKDQMNVKPPVADANPAPTMKDKFPDSATRQMAHANGEDVVKAVGNDPETMKAIHNMSRVELSKAAENGGLDLGQRNISNAKVTGGGSITRQEVFSQLLKKGYTPKEILELAKK